MKKILIVSQYYYPEQFRINDIAETLVQQGYAVTVYTGIPNYPKGNFFDGYSLSKKRKEIHNGVKIRRFPIFPRKKNFICLTLNYISFVISVGVFTFFSRERYDFVFNYEVSPMTQALPAVWLSKRSKCPFAIDITDLWPDNVIAITGIKNKIIINLLNKLNDYVFKNATYIMASSESYVRILEDRGYPSHKISFWPHYAEDCYYPVFQRKDSSTFSVIFAGNIGFAQGLLILPDVADALSQCAFDKKIVFKIVGNGLAKDALKKKVEEKKVSEFFDFVDPVPNYDIPKLFSDSDVVLISLLDSPVFNNVIPSKVQSCMACAMPILALANGEVFDIVKKAECGVACHAGNIQEMIDAINVLMKNDLLQYSDNSRKYYEKNFDKNLVINKLIEKIEVVK